MPKWSHVTPWNKTRTIVYQRPPLVCAAHVNDAPGGYEWFVDSGAPGTGESGFSSSEADARRQAMRACGRTMREGWAYMLRERELVAQRQAAARGKRRKRT